MSVCDVHFATVLHHANQCIAATFDERHIVREAESSGEGSYRALGGHVIRRWAAVTIRERGGMLFAAFSGA
jgi:hypothetical protein